MDDILKHESLKDLVISTHDGSRLISKLKDNYAKLYSSIFSKSKQDINKNKRKVFKYDILDFHVNEVILHEHSFDFISEECDKELVRGFFKSQLVDIAWVITNILFPSKGYIHDCFDDSIRKIGVRCNKFIFWDADEYSTINFKYTFSIKKYLAKWYEFCEQDFNIDKNKNKRRPIYFDIFGRYDWFCNIIDTVNKVFENNYNHSEKDTSFDKNFEHKYHVNKLSTIITTSIIDVVKYLILTNIVDIWKTISNDKINIEDFQLLKVKTHVSSDIDKYFDFQFKIKTKFCPKFWWDDKTRLENIHKEFEVNREKLYEIQ